MSKIVKTKYKISRRLGVNLWGRAKDPFNARAYVPGQHGPSLARKKTDYGNQLQAKQRLKGYYNMQEKAFRKVYEEASRRKGDTSEHIIGLLERQLVAVVYRANLAPTIFSARQLVSHKHITVNGKVVNISSYRVKDGDVIAVREKSRNMLLILGAVQNKERSIPSYLEVDDKALSAKFITQPKLADVPYAAVMEPNLVVEFYSR